MSHDQLSDDQILRIVSQTDRELFRAGIDIKRRSVQVPERVMHQFGFTSYVVMGPGQPEILKRIQSAFNSIYRKHDLAMGGHIGAFMYRDIFARISVPLIFGTVNLDPFDYVDLTPVQLRIIQSEPEESHAFVDQFADVADIQYGTEELDNPYAAIELVTRFLGLARLHLHAAAAIVTGGYDFRGAVQSALLATELSLKSAVAAQGLSEEKIKREFRHDIAGLVSSIAAFWPRFDDGRVGRVVARQPQYVRNRYASAQPERREVGHTVMGAQFVVSEVVRLMSDRDVRACLHPPSERIYPA